MAARDPKAVKPGEGRALRVLGNTFTFKVVATDTNDTYSIFEVASPPNGGIPPHVNTRETETHIVLQSTYSFLLGMQTYEAGPGTVFFVPRATLHGFQNVGTGQGAAAIVRRGLTLSPEGWRLFTKQTVEQNLRLGAVVLPDRSRVPFLLDRVYTLFPQLTARARRRAGTLSGGERQMLALGRALMSDPKLLLLDEPSLGLAPAILDALYETLRRLHREGLTLLLAEQSVALALDVADYAYVLQTGRTVLEGPAQDLRQNLEVQRIYLGMGGDTAT